MKTYKQFKQQVHKQQVQKRNLAGSVASKQSDLVKRELDKNKPEEVKEEIIGELSDQLKHKIVKQKDKVKAQGALAIMKGDEQSKAKADKHMNTISKIENEKCTKDCLNDLSDHINRLKSEHGLSNDDIISHIKSL